MSSELPKIYDIGELVDVTQGLAINSKTKHLLRDSGLPLLRITDLFSGSYSQFVSQEGVPKQCIANNEELIYTRTGQVGFVFTNRVGVVHNNCFKVTPKDGRLSRRYLYWFLRQESVRIYVNTVASGSVQKDLNHSAFKTLKIPVPDLKTQRQVDSILSSLDDRITLLRETNATLEAIAQALFKSWFVDFEPVRAKMAGRAPEGLDVATAALFPDALEETELGVVPKGWRIGCVEELCSTITNGGTPSRSKTSFWDGGSIPWFKTGEFHDGFLLKPSERITDDALSGSSVKLLPKDAILMAIYAAPTVGRLGILTEPATFNQACTGMVAKAEVGPWFLFWTLFNGRDWFNSRANGAAQQNISKAIVAAYRMGIPSQPVLDAFNRAASTLHDAIRLNAEKSQTLSELRDTLLPRLISGQLRLPEAMAALEDAPA